ncbi:MAG: hypothetical protein RLZZ519_2613 [Bacteroidota bacterium]
MLVPKFDAPPTFWLSGLTEELSRWEMNFDQLRLLLNSFDSTSNEDWRTAMSLGNLSLNELDELRKEMRLKVARKQDIRGHLELILRRKIDKNLSKWLHLPPLQFQGEDAN